MGKFGEDAHFNGAKERLRCPKAQTYLHDVVR
jgi:hypothetical protein